MTLTDDDIVAAAETALRVLEIDGAVGFWQPPAWLPVADDHPDYAILRIAVGDDDITPSVYRPGGRNVAVRAVLDACTNDASETSAYWGMAFPRCPGHTHPADYGVEDSAIWLRCPESGTEFRRVTV